MNRKLGSVFGALSAAALFAGCVDSPEADPSTTSAEDFITVSKPGGAQVVLSTIGTTTSSSPSAAHLTAARTANAFLANRPTQLQIGPKDAFVQKNVE